MSESNESNVVVVAQQAALAEVGGEQWVEQAVGVLVDLIRHKEDIEAAMKEASAPYKEMLEEAVAPYKPELVIIAAVEEALRARVLKEHEGAAGVKTTKGEFVFQQPWKWRVAEAEKVPKKFLEVSSKAVTEAVKAGMRKIAGIEVWQDRTLVVRKGAVKQ